ncbi:MAG: hypothetical protein FJ304_20130 [Planctomycetes bacterium]|nr:hypothetical protein [Planctomycetota bacterium]
MPPDPAHILLFDTATGKRTARIDGFQWCSAIAPDGKTVAVARDYHMTPTNRSPIAFWDAETNRIRYPVKLPKPFVNRTIHALHYLPDGRHLVVVGSFGVRLWDLQTENWVEHDNAPEARLGENAQVSFTPIPDGVLIATLTTDGIAQVWKVTAPRMKP